MGDNLKGSGINYSIYLIWWVTLVRNIQGANLSILNLFIVP